MMTLEDDQKSRTDLRLSWLTDELVSYGGEAKILPICPNISLDGLIWPTISPDEIFKEPLLTGIVLYRVHCVM